MIMTTSSSICLRPETSMTDDHAYFKAFSKNTSAPLAETPRIVITAATITLAENTLAVDAI